MEKEKNFFIVIIITVCVLLVYPIIAKQFFPQYFSEKVTQEQADTNINKEPTTYDTANRATPQARQADPIKSPKDATASQKKSYVLENNRFELIINSPMAEIKSIKFLNMPEPATRLPTVLMDTKNMIPGIFADTGFIENATLEKVEQDSNSITFYYNHAAGLTIRKHIGIDDKTYGISLSVEIKNPSSREHVLSYRIIAATGIENVKGIEGRYCNQITVFKNQKALKKSINSVKDATTAGDIQLTGFMLRYFSLVMAPLVTTDFTYSYDHGHAEDFSPASVGIGVNRLVVPARDKVRLDYVLYAGPNDQEEMSRLNLGIETIRGKGFFAGLSDLLLLLLRALHKLFKNYGVAVIGLALTINLFLYPLTFKSLKSMKEMQALQPLVENIRTEHKDNPQKLNKEIMELYKKHKINPAGGCLPMLLQMPVFFSLYGVLMRAIELRGANFLWIKDLASPDAFVSFPAKLPFVGSSLNLLPLIMVAVSFLQQKLTNAGHSSEQQRMMGLMMPIFLGFIFYNFPSGLVLYFLTNSIFSVVIQSKISRSPAQTNT